MFIVICRGLTEQACVPEDFHADIAGSGQGDYEQFV
jgi:hypothetical protein